MAGFGPVWTSCRGSPLHSVLGAPRLVFSPNPLLLRTAWASTYCA